MSRKGNPARASDAPVLSVQGLKVRREGVEILKGVELDVRKGEHWVILGPNGCGKTSLLLSITGYLMPSAGSISVLGSVYGRTDWRELRRSIGIVSSAIRQQIEPGEIAIDLVASGRDAVLNMWRPLKKAERHIAMDWLQEMGVEHLARREWRCFSAGERQRLLIARALMAAPRVLILDEACAGLDPIARERFLERLDRLAVRPDSPAILFVTHHIEEVRPWMSHTLLMRNGRVAGAGPSRLQLREKPLTGVFAHAVRPKCKNGHWRLDISV